MDVAKFFMRCTYTPNLVIISLSSYRGNIVNIMEFTKLTSVTLEVGYRGNAVHMMKFTKLTSVTLEVGHSDPYTIPSKFSTRGSYTPNLVILAHHSLLTLLQYRELDRWHSQSWPLWPWKWVTVTHIQSQLDFFHERYLHTKFSNPSSFPSQVIVVTRVGQTDWLTDWQTDGRHSEENTRRQKVLWWKWKTLEFQFWIFTISCFLTNQNLLSTSLYGVAYNVPSVTPFTVGAKLDWGGPHRVEKINTDSNFVLFKFGAKYLMYQHFWPIRADPLPVLKTE